MDYSKLSDATLEKISKNEPLDYSKLSDDELDVISKATPQTVAVPSIPETPPQEPIGYGETALRGAAQGLTFGFADELQAKTEELLGGDDYEKRVKEIRERNKQAAEENPITYYGSDILSGFALPLGAFGSVAKNASKIKHLKNITKAAEAAGDLEKAAYYTKQLDALRPGMMKVAGQAATTGAAMGGLAGAGTSEGETSEDVAKDVALGATAGAVLGPLMEGGVSAISKLTSRVPQKVGAIADVRDSLKLGSEGIDISGGESARRIVGEGFQTIEKEFIPELEQALKVKNRLYEEGKQASEAAGRTVNIKQLEDLVNKAEQAGADPKQIEKLRRELGVLGQRQEVQVTDPGEYQTLFREKVGEESQKLKERAYEIQLKNAEKAGSVAAKEADRQNKELIKQVQAELKVINPAASNQELLDLAQKQLQGRLKDPNKAAQEARDKVLSEAQETFAGQAVRTEPITGEDIVTAATGKNKQIVEPLRLTEEGTVANRLAPKVAVDVTKAADKNAAYAYALAERENNKAVQDLARIYGQQQMNMSRGSIISELKSQGKWIDPVQAAKRAKDETILSGKPIDVSTTFSPEINRSVLTASSGDEELARKILPDFQFTKQEYQKPDLGVRDVEAFRNYISNLVNKDQQLDFRSLGELQKVSSGVKDTYSDLLGKTTAEAALNTDKEIRKSLAELGVDSLIGDSGIENKINLRDKLTTIIGAANSAKGSHEFNKVQNAFEGLLNVYKNDPIKRGEVQSAFNSVKDKMRQAYLADTTVGHNTFAIDPASINWTMTAAGKLNMGANQLGLVINKVAESAPGQMMAQSKRFLDKGYTQYSRAFEKMAMETPTKRRAIMYTLLQQPQFRQAFSADILGENEGE